VQVGLAWRIVAGPALGLGPVGPDTPPTNPELQKHMEALAEVDKSAPKTPPTPKEDEAVVQYNLKRVEIIDKILDLVKDQERDLWQRQKADNLSTAALHAKAGNNAALQRLQRFRDQVAKASPGSNVAGYLTFRTLWTEYSPQIVGPNSEKVQAEWLEKLAGFVQNYPKADDTPDALILLAMGKEFGGKEEEAKRWYNQLAVSFPEHALAAKARGAKERLELPGKTMTLSGKTSTGSAFDLTSLKGKVVAVYYWAGYSDAYEKDFEALKKLHAKLGAKGFEIVTVSLDDSPEDAQGRLQKAGLPGTHVIQPSAEGGGLNGPLAIQYGIMGVPNLFLVGKDGKVISRMLHSGDLETAVQKAL
jgi:Thioredoxin-like